MAVGELSFAFNPAAGETPETVKRKRMLAEAILGQASRAPKDVGEGLNAIGQALLYRKMMSDAGKGETAGASAASKIFQSLMGSNFICGNHNGFHPRSADFIKRCAGNAEGDARTLGCLTGRGLT